MATTFDILIDIQARVEAIQKATAEMKNLTKEANSFGQAFKLAEFIDLTGRLNNALREIPHLLGEAVKQGIEFNSLMESSRIGVAGMLRQFGGSEFKDFNSALKDSDRLIALLQGKANQLGLSFEAMLEQYRTTAGALFSGGVRDLQKQVDLTVLLQQAVGSLGITGFQAQRDIFDLIEGRASRTIAGKALGITDEEVQRASQAGHLYEFLTEKFRALGDAGRVLGTTLQASEQRAKNFGDILAGIATQDVFTQLKDSLNELNKALADPRTAEAARGAGTVLHAMVVELENAIQRAREFGAVFAKIPGTLPFIFNKLGAGDTFATGQATQFVETEAKAVGLIQDQIAASQTLEERRRAFLALTQEINKVEERTRDSNHDIATAAEIFLAKLREILSVFGQVAGTAAQTKTTIEQTAKATAAIAEVQAKIALLRAEASGDEETIAAERGKVAYQQILDSLKEKQVPEEEAKKLAHEYAEAVESAARAKVEQKSAQHDFNAELRVESDLLKDIRAQERLISESPFLSADQKQSQLHDLFAQDQQQVLEAMERLRVAAAQPDVYGDPQKIEAVKEKLRELGTEYVELEFKLQTTTFGGSIGAELNDWLNSFGTTAHQVASIITGTLNTAIQGTSSALTGLIFGTQNWRQAFASAAQSIVQNIIQIGLQILLQQTIGAAIRRAFGAAGIAATQAEAAAAHAAWAPAAIAASIASYGAAAGAGLTAYLGAEAVGVATSFIPGFHTGGVVGDGETPAFHAGGLSRSERLVKALVGEGFFLPEQMANLYVKPGSEHLFKADQLAAIGNAGEAGEGPYPGYSPSNPPPLGATDIPPAFPQNPNPQPVIPPSQVPRTPGPGTFPDDPQFIEPTEVTGGPRFRFNVFGRDPSDVGPALVDPSQIDDDGNLALQRNPNNVTITEIGHGRHGFDWRAGDRDLHQDSHGNVIGYSDSPIFHTGFQSGPHEGVDITQNLIQSTILAHHQLHSGGVVPINAHEGEGILNIDAMSAIGADGLHALNKLSHSVHRPSFDSGGIIGGDSASPDGGSLSLGAGDTHVFLYLDRQKLLRDMMNSSASKKVLRDFLRDAA